MSACTKGHTTIWYDCERCEIVRLEQELAEIKAKFAVLITSGAAVACTTCGMTPRGFKICMMPAVCGGGADHQWDDVNIPASVLNYQHERDATIAVLMETLRDCIELALTKDPHEIIMSSPTVSGVARHVLNDLPAHLLHYQQEHEAMAKVVEARRHEIACNDSWRCLETEHLDSSVAILDLDALKDKGTND